MYLANLTPSLSRLAKTAVALEVFLGVGALAGAATPTTRHFSRSTCSLEQRPPSLPCSGSGKLDGRSRSARRESRHSRNELLSHTGWAEQLTVVRSVLVYDA
jgi:hypothetical protein